MSTTGSAQRHVEDSELAPLDVAAPSEFQLTSPELSTPEAPTALRQHAVNRLAAHRARRGVPEATPSAKPQIRPQAEPAPKAGPTRVAQTRSAYIAAAVAERYAQSQTYRAFLAAEAERAVHQAEAAAQVATINAQAIAVAQNQLLAHLEQWHTPHAGPSTAPAPHVPLAPLDYAQLFPQETAPTAPAIPVQPVSVTVRPFADTSRPSAPVQLRAQAEAEFDEDERYALDDEIEFRHNPVFDEVSAPEPIAANLIEFPRQLVAARKARPRLAEGPLRDDGTTNTSQLRIFEVEPDHLTLAPAAEAAAPEWTSILLAALPSADFASSDLDYLSVNIPHAAPVRKRLISAAVDACLILATEAAFVTVASLALTHLAGQHSLLDLPRIFAAAAALITFFIFALLYQLLFFNLSDATPGMRFARIGLCTLTDENPTRSELRRRILANLVATLPLGLGLLWAFLDEDTLGWHDRLSRMYQRSY